MNWQEQNEENSEEYTLLNIHIRSELYKFKKYASMSLALTMLSILYRYIQIKDVVDKPINILQNYNYCILPLCSTVMLLLFHILAFSQRKNLYWLTENIDMIEKLYEHIIIIEGVYIFMWLQAFCYIGMSMVTVDEYPFGSIWLAATVAPAVLNGISLNATHHLMSQWIRGLQSRFRFD